MALRRFWMVGVVILLGAGAMACSTPSESNSEDSSVQTDSAADAAEDNSVPACVAGEACDDGDPCTQNDACNEEGQCVGVAQAETCLSVECGGSVCDGKGGCTEVELKPGFCLIKGVCYAEGDSNPENECEKCVTTTSTEFFAPMGDSVTCDDGNPCTQGDRCAQGSCIAGDDGTCDDELECTKDSCTETGCVHEADDAACDDDNSCTTDTCDPASGCGHAPDDTAVCGDGNVCTLNNHCSGGVCVSDGELDCFDDNPCTDEFCHASFGCIFNFNEDPCSDGEACTEEDTCHFGHCEGIENYWYPCPACSIEFGPHVQKVVALRFGSGGMPGEALNVDSDIKTCSPPSSCQDGLDNTLSFAADIVNPVLADNLSDPEAAMIILAVLQNPTWDGQPFMTSLQYAVLDDSNPLCDVQHEVCTYRSGNINFDPLCKPKVALTNATIVDNVLTAGGSGYVFPYKMYFVGDVEVEMVLYNAKVQATLTTLPDNTITHLSGVLAGAIKPEDLTTLVEAIPSEFFPGGDKQAMLNLVGMMPRDIDVNGDGVKDAFSLGLVFETNLGVLNPYQSIW